MWVEIFLASLWGGIVAMDTTALLQIQVSRPMVACSIIGLILGNFQLGFTIGILLELLYINELPVGGAAFAEGNVGSAAAAAIAILSLPKAPERMEIIIVITLLLAAVISWLAGVMVRWMRHANGKVFESILNKEIITPMTINLGQLAGIVLAFLLGFLNLFVSCVIFARILPSFLHYVPTIIDKILYPVIGGLLAVGCIYLVHIFWTQGERKRLFALGVIIGAIWLFAGI